MAVKFTLPEGVSLDDVEEIHTSGQIRSELAVEPVVCPEWPGPSGKPGLYLVSELAGGDFDDYQSAMFKVDGSDYELNMRENNMRLLAKCLINRDGNPLWPSVEAGIKEMRFKGQGGIARLSAVARRLNGLDRNAQRRAEGKSEPGPTSGSSFGSPENSATPVGEPSFAS